MKTNIKHFLFLTLMILPFSILSSREELSLLKLYAKNLCTRKKVYEKVKPGTQPRKETRTGNRIVRPLVVSVRGGHY